MTFKTNWEKTNQHVEIAPETIAAMVAQAFPDHPLLSYDVISGGCANLNIKIVLDSGPYILRIYLRDQDAAYRECNIANLMKYDIPIPEVLFIGDQIEGGTSYRFAITQFMEGIPLRDLLLNYPEDAWRGVMVDMGEMLSEFRRISFPHAGFFDGNLNVPKPFQPDDLVNFVSDCLNNLQVQKALGDSMVQQLKEIFQVQRLHLPDESDPHLVHGDFDPANILVHQAEGKWVISAILDWEFAFAGSWLWDVANMLRYAHQMPGSYENSFLEGFEKGGLELPENWRITIALLNISSLLDSLGRHPIHERPILRQDICQLIGHMVKNISPTTPVRNNPIMITKPLPSHDGLSLTIAHPIPMDDPFFIEACRTVIFGLDAYNKQITGIIPKRQLFYTDSEGSPKLIADIRQYSLNFDNSNVDTLESILALDPDFLTVLEAYAYKHGARRAFSWSYKDTRLFDVFIDAGFIPTGEFPDLEVNKIVQRFYKDLAPSPSNINHQTYSKISISEECDADYTEEHVSDLLNNPDSFGIFIQDTKNQSVKGGIMGTIYKAKKKGIPCGYINSLWVDSSLRTGDSQKNGSGLGKSLVMEAEKLFKEQGAKYAQATTNGFQAPGFYEKLGYVMVKSCPGHLLLKDNTIDDVFECTKEL